VTVRVTVSLTLFWPWIWRLAAGMSAKLILLLGNCRPETLKAKQEWGCLGQSNSYVGNSLG
jgi:hypothetical protein